MGAPPVEKLASLAPRGRQGALVPAGFRWS
jgi:hypothetical protein